MANSPNIAKIGALIGDNTRARMLSTLMQGKALTASELARCADVTAQTATSHLAKLETGGLLIRRKQGRHRYFALANEEVAALLESMMGITAKNESPPIRTGPRDAKLHAARVCYNHLAGARAVQLYDNLLARNLLIHQDGTLTLSETGQQFVKGFGIDLQRLQSSQSPLCRECLDWSERRTHLSGSLGRAFMARFEALAWARREAGRIVTFSPQGSRAFNAAFGS